MSGWNPYSTPSDAARKRRAVNDRGQRMKRVRAYQSESNEYVRVLGKRRDES